MDNRDPTQPLPEEELLDDLVRLADELGRTPKPSDIDDDGKFSSSVYYKRFDGIREARRKAGLKENIDRTERVEFTCDRCGKVEKRKPSVAEARDYCSYTCSNQATFGVEAAELLDALRTLADDLDRAPSAREFDEKTDHWHGVLGDKFGSYSDAVREIGYDPKAPKDVSDDKLLEDLKDIHAETGRPPKQSDLQHSGSVSTPWPYVDRWGSWAGALEAAGIEPTTRQYKKIGRAELIQEYTRLADDLGRAPSYTEVGERAKFSTAAYDRAFGSFLNAKAECGFEPVAADNQPRGQDHYLWTEDSDPRYGKSWSKQRERCLDRDSHKCQRCGITSEEHQETVGVDLHVHHITPAREFDDHKERNKLSNLVTLCASCHIKWERMPVRPQTGEVER